MNTEGTVTAESLTYTVTSAMGYCGHKLPCGVCKLMMCMCPINGTPVITPTLTVTTGTGGDTELTSETKTAVGDMRGEE